VPAPMATGRQYAAAGSYYLGRAHQLIHRHHETITIKPDQTGRWELWIDLELPQAAEAQHDFDGREADFIFPLIFLKKSEGRTGFGARDEDGKTLTLANRRTCNWISAAAAARAGNRLLSERAIPALPHGDLEYVLWCVCSWKPYGASVILHELLKRVESIDPRIAQVWKEEGFTGDLEMLVDHSLVWTPLRGLPGERRSIEVMQDLELLRRPLRRWVCRELKSTRWRRLRRRKARRYEDSGHHLDTGAAKYGRRGIPRVSFSVLGERLAQPLAWLPIEFDFPTIYTRRCSSYHFELVCPPGLSPRGIKLATSEPEHRQLEGRTVLGTRAAEVYLPRGRSAGDVMLRATVGVGRGAFPILWFLMVAITATMLWILAGTNPTDLLLGKDTESRNEIAAGILLVVPALAAAVLIGREDEPVSQLLGGARILLLVAGLSAVAATAVLLEAEPWNESPRAAWTACATIATAATIPLATSWLLSLRFVWRGLNRLDTTLRQYLWLFCLTGAALAIVFALEQVPDGLLRGLLALSLLLLAVPLILLASNRAAVSLDAHRCYLPVGAMLVAVVCVALGCIEMRSAIDPDANHHEVAETRAIYALLLAAFAAGPLLTLLTWPFRQMPGEAHIAPGVQEALVAGERIRDLPRLRNTEFRQLPCLRRLKKRLGGWRGLFKSLSESGLTTERGVVAERVDNTEADWSSGVRSTVVLPPWQAGEYSHFVDLPEVPYEDLTDEEREIRKMNGRMDALRPPPT
jgi:hypothetical protein